MIATEGADATYQRCLDIAVQPDRRSQQRGLPADHAQSEHRRRRYHQSVVHQRGTGGLRRCRLRGELVAPVAGRVARSSLNTSLTMNLHEITQDHPAARADRLEGFRAAEYGVLATAPVPELRLPGVHDGGLRPRHVERAAEAPVLAVDRRTTRAARQARRLSLACTTPCRPTSCSRRTRAFGSRTSTGWPSA